MLKRIFLITGIALITVLLISSATAAGETIALKRYTRVTGYREAENPACIDGRGWVNMDVEDTVLVRKTPQLCYGSHKLLTVSKDGGDNTLIAFKALNRAIYRNSTITDVKLRLHPVQGEFSPEGEISVYRVFVPWRDGGSGPEPKPVYWAANYTHRYYSKEGSGIKWALRGARARGKDIAAKPSFRAKLKNIYSAETNTVVMASPQMLEDVRFWYEHYYLNYGWIITYRAGRRERAVQMFHSSDVVDERFRPSLEITFERPASPKPNDIDLDVTYISRTPRYLRYLDEGQGQYESKKFRGENVGIMKYPKFGDEQKWPKHGDDITFTAHVKNKGKKPFSGTFDYRWILNEKVVDSGRFKGNLDPGKETAFEYEWKWDVDHSDHRDLYIVFWVDPDEKIKETSKNNNWLKKYIEGRTLKYWVEQTLYDYANNAPNAWGSYSFEDYLQWHAHMWNETFMDKSRFDVIAPDGCLERITLDEIEIVPDGLLDPWGKHTPKASIKSPAGTGLADCHFDGEWGSCWNWDTKNPEYEKQIQGLKNFIDSRAVLLEGSWIHECSHQCIAAFDVYWSNLEAAVPSDASRAKVKFKDGDHFITRGLWYVYGGMMGGDDTRPNPKYRIGTELYSLHSVAGFNSNLPYRAGFFGEWQYDVPKKCAVKLIGGGGVPLSNAKVGIWQVVSNALRNENLVAENLRADENGVLVLPNQDSLEETDVTVATGHTLLKKNPFGRIGVVGTNSVLLLRIEAFGQKDYRFVLLFDLNKGYWLGHKDYHVIPVETNITPTDKIDWSVNVAENKSVTASRGAESASKACDGDLKTAWSAPDSREGDYVVIDLGEVHNVGAVRFVQDEGHAYFYPRFKIETSAAKDYPSEEMQLFFEEEEKDFGYRMGLEKDMNPENEAERWITYPGKPRPTRYLRITATQAGNVKIDEIQIYAERE